MRLAGVILAGGQARRMGGGDKGLLDLGGRPLLAHVIARLEPQVDMLILNANGAPDRFAEFGLPVVADSVEGFAGPLSGVLAGMDRAAGTGATHVISAAADTPFFPCDLAPRLCLAAEREDVPIALAATTGADGTHRHPTFGLWPVALREDLRAALAGGVRKVVQWADRHGTASVSFPAAPFDPFFNVNTPDDMDRARSILKGLDA